MPVFCAVYECLNRPNRENTRSFHRVRKCVVHKGISQEIERKNAGKKWLVNLRLLSTGADRIMLVCANG